jgi:AsmA-like protein
MDADAQPLRLSRKRTLFLALLAALLAVAVVPPFFTINGFRHRLEQSMTAAVGRKTTVGNVYLRLLPQPGFELKNFAIQDDPTLSSEPLLSADDVTADLRLLPLWRGQIEISTLDLQDPSLNVVRGADGHWNVEPLLMHASQVPTAPTANRYAEARPRFPYIEASNGRINFKIGDEKKVFALSETDFSLWLASENEWQMRLSGRPMRTDLDLGDTGTLRLSGRFQRAPSVAQTPLRFDVAWEKGQLGQMTELIYGRDRGWRGTVDALATLAGSPASLNMSGKVSISDFRRYDIASSDSFNTDVHCDAQYEGASLSVESVLRGTCNLTRDGGLLNATLLHLPATGETTVNLVAASFPMSTVVALAHHMKRGLAPDLTAEGFLNGSLTLHRGPQPEQPSDKTAPPSSTITVRAVLQSKDLGSNLDMGVLVFNFGPPTPAGKTRGRGAKIHPVQNSTLTLLPAPLPMGGALPLVVNASADSQGYAISFRGEADAQRFRELLGTLGLATLDWKANGAGRAKVDVNVGGQWAGFPPPVIAGDIKPQAPTALARGKLQ